MASLQTSVEQHSYFGEPAVTLTAGPYTAMVLPEAGGNLVSFRDVERGLSFLRAPQEEDMEEFQKGSVVYGIPVLFPPNRFEDGMFTAGGRAYHFPINEEATHNHLHGLLLGLPWQVKSLESDTDLETASVELTHRLNEQHPGYAYFPHECEFVIRYTLSRAGLQQDVRVTNTGSTSMPFMLAFHTTFNVPFAVGSREDNYTFAATIGERWELTGRMLPTGSFQALTNEEREIKSGAGKRGSGEARDGVSPFYTEMDNHYTASPQNGSKYATLTDHRLGLRLVYDVGLKYKQWMVFNNFGRGEFICPEPQTCVVNAPNTGLSEEESGLILLKPGQTWTETSRMYVEMV